MNFVSFAIAFLFLSMIGSATAISKIVSSYCESVAKNPEAGHILTNVVIIGIACVEVTALLIFAISYLMLGH